MGVYVALHDPRQESAGYTSKYRGLGLLVELLLLLLKPDPTSGKQNTSAKGEQRAAGMEEAAPCCDPFSLSASPWVKCGTLQLDNPSSAAQEHSELSSAQGDSD